MQKFSETLNKMRDEKKNEKNHYRARIIVILRAERRGEKESRRVPFYIPTLFLDFIRLLGKREMSF